MEALRLDEKSILDTFDALVHKGIIFYGPATVIRNSDNGFSFEFRICSSFSYKPGLPDANFYAGSRQTFGPGSDLFKDDPSLTVAEINGTHILALNIYCVFRPQYLILTLDSYQRQTTPLDRTDLAAAWNLLHATRTEQFVIYNCGTEAGCSRSHKHMQVFPLPGDFKMFPDRQDLGAGNVPFKFCMQRFDHNFEESLREDIGNLYQVYSKLFREAGSIWAAAQLVDPGYLPHNVVLTKNWMVIIPRRQASFNSASANAAGMMGMVWVSEQRLVDQWTQLGPSKILSELGIH